MYSIQYNAECRIQSGCFYVRSILIEFKQYDMYSVSKLNDCPNKDVELLSKIENTSANIDLSPSPHSSVYFVNINTAQKKYYLDHVFFTSGP